MKSRGFGERFRAFLAQRWLARFAVLGVSLLVGVATDLFFQDTRLLLEANRTVYGVIQKRLGETEKQTERLVLIDLMPISGHFGCVPREISEDGGVVVGNSGNIWGGSYYPAMWRAANNWAPELLANLGGSAGEAWDIRGGVIIGFATTPSGERRAVRWQLGTATTQVEDLNQTYAALLSDGSVLRSANAFSANGRFIVGWGRNAATGRDEAYLLDTGCTPHSGDVDNNGCIDDADLLAVLFAFGNTGSNLGREDANGDGTVDDADLLTVLFNFGSGC